MYSNHQGAVTAGRFLQTCDIAVSSYPIPPCTMVIFGGAGDLSRRKLLPALFHLFRDNELAQGLAIIAVGRSPMTDEEYRRRIQETVREFSQPPWDEEKWGQFRKRLFYFVVPLENGESYRALCGKIEELAPPVPDGRKEVVYYMALPPETTPQVIGQLQAQGLCRERFHTKIVMEKPFGRDYESARQLNAILTQAFTEEQIYRIDHYLGKETVQNIIFFRFANSIFEQLWNRRYINHIQITVAEDIGVENRAAFYERSGAVRDILQNHLLQLIGLVAMEPPIGFEADFIRNEKMKVFQAIRPMEERTIERDMVRGQYGPGTVGGKEVPGYRQEKGVAPDSSLETFFAGVFEIANWRWAGVPFFVRTGKRLARRVTEIAIQFDQPPLRLFGRTCDALDPNILVLTIQPEEKISLRFGVKYPYGANQISPIDMNFSYREAFQMTSLPSYERLLVDCLKGDLTLFVRQDQIEAM